MNDLGASIPRTISGWQSVGEDKTYDAKTIYDYLDGGAEVYLAFDLRQVFVRKYKGPAGAEIALDIYDMGSAEEAYGVFSCDRQDPGAGIGQDSEYGPGLLRFRQGRFFVSVTASGDEQAAREPILALGKAVFPLLGPDGASPDLLGLLPPQGLNRDRTAYFHSVVNLNNLLYISAENVLNLDKKTDCVLAEYSLPEGGPVKLLLVRYPDPGSARAARDSLLRSYQAPAGGANAVQTESGRRAKAHVQDRFVAVVFDAPSEDCADRLQAAIKYPVK